MTVLLFQLNSYLQEFDAKIIALDYDEHGIILDRTAFYLGVDDQPNNTGIVKINDMTHQVIKVTKVGDDIMNLMDCDSPLPELYTEVNGMINWEQRYKIMRTHTALHTDS